MASIFLARSARSSAMVIRPSFIAGFQESPGEPGKDR
jgi:hypothetical protein